MGTREFLGKGHIVPFPYCYFLLTPTQKAFLQLRFVRYENTTNRCNNGKVLGAVCHAKLLCDIISY